MRNFDPMENNRIYEDDVNVDVSSDDEDEIPQNYNRDKLINSRNNDYKCVSNTNDTKRVKVNVRPSFMISDILSDSTNSFQQDSREFRPPLRVQRPTELRVPLLHGGFGPFDNHDISDTHSIDSSDNGKY